MLRADALRSRGTAEATQVDGARLGLQHNSASAAPAS